MLTNNTRCQWTGRWDFGFGQEGQTGPETVLVLALYRSTTEKDEAIYTCKGERTGCTWYINEAELTPITEGAE